MLFNSIDFAIFLPIVFTLYWSLGRRSRQAQNALLLAASLVFYGWWDWRFLGLILFSASLDFVIGRNLVQTTNPRRRNILLACSLIGNLGLLGLFKYFNFFLDSLIGVFALMGRPIEVSGLTLILPVGISFYTFQTLSHTIDVYRGAIKPSRRPLTFLLFVSFFPQLVAGPIERAANLLPQLERRRVFDYQDGVSGLRLILWGLFKKMVIADNAARYVNEIFADPASHSGSTLALGAVLFAFQIYGDFSGYSDVAIGTARLFGIRLMHNFACPYFSRDVAEFWRRWHISLSTWFRDYLYIPLGGSKGSTTKTIRNLWVIFLISGLWHGANWTFVAWGALHALYFMPLLLMNRHRAHLDTVAAGRLIPSLWELLHMGLTFALTCLAWILFRSETLAAAWIHLSGIFSSSLFTIPDILPLNVLLAVTLFVAVEWVQREREHVLDLEALNLPKWVRWAVYYVLIAAIAGLGTSPQAFIYFQF